MSQNTRIIPKTITAVDVDHHNLNLERPLAEYSEPHHNHQHLWTETSMSIRLLIQAVAVFHSNDLKEGTSQRKTSPQDVLFQVQLLVHLL